MDTLDFFRLVLPGRGYYCAVTIVDKQWRHKFFDNIEALTDFVLDEDKKGREVYHACGAYTEGVMDPHGTPKHLRTRGRTHKNIRALRSLWLDIDCGEGKPYANQLMAYNAVKTFCDVNRVPSPLYVNSGYGLHIYWPLVQDIQKEVWESLSSGLAYLCERYGLKIDPARACDCSSILRPVGTHNRKRGGCKEVTWSGPVGPYSIGEFDGLCNFARNTGRIKNFEQTNFTEAALNLYGPSTARAEEIAEQCGQVSRLRDGDGSLSEPEWYAILGVLAYCQDGREFAHFWGSQFQQYTFEGTEAKFIQRQQSAGPTTCEHFNSLDKRCQSCQLWGEITSPIQIRSFVFSWKRESFGIEFNDELQTNTDNRKSDRLNSETGESEFPLQGMGSFELRYDGLYNRTENKDGELENRLICAQPCWLTTINEGENGGKFYYGFEWDLPNNSLRSFIIDARSFHSSSGLAEFQGQGPIIHETDLFKKFVREEIDDWHRENKVSTRYDQLGWKDDFNAFLFGNKLYEKGGVIRHVQPSVDITYKTKDLGPKKGGSLAEWSRAANELYDKGLEAHSFALLASFAAPLMSCHVESEGGAVIAMVSSQSGTGKSTVLDAVSSVWGNRSALEMTNRDTEISRAISLGVLHNLPVVLDELRFRDPETTRDFITMFTVGKDKTRANRDGTLQQNNYRWQTILVGGSNYSLVDLLETDSTNALALRVFEFKADLPFEKKKGDALRRELVRNAGWVGDAYIKALLQPGNIEFIQQAIPKWSAEIYDVCKLSREHRFWVRTTVSILIAAAIVRQLGILEFSVDRIKEWILQKLSSKVNEAKGISDQTPSTILGSFLAEHALDTLTVSGAAGKGAPSVQVIREERRNLYIRAEESTGLLYIDRDIYKKWLYKHGFNREENIGELKRIRVITKECTKTLGAGTGKASASRPAYEIDARHPDILGYVYEGWKESSKIIPIRRER